ncbi:hypothetical protein DPMN_006671 [Dreissena polymorpha]|uniref:Uncharacterized protein n=1 Tax=Dreissena polymorpha TaxID=45954 RepID=A0A9D4MRW0_DREPO|nr:hypothetical protein DPMN_006671 [Dreissena polymorpha]
MAASLSRIHAFDCVRKKDQKGTKKMGTVSFSRTFLQLGSLGSLLDGGSCALLGLPLLRKTSHMSRRQNLEFRYVLCTYKKEKTSLHKKTYKKKTRDLDVGLGCRTFL